MYVPAAPEQFRVEVWLAPRTMLVELSVQVSPVAGDIVDARVTVPAKPFTGATVIVDVAVAPATTVADVGLAVTV